MTRWWLRDPTCPTRCHPCTFSKLKWTYSTSTPTTTSSATITKECSLLRAARGCSDTTVPRTWEFSMVEWRSGLLRIGQLSLVNKCSRNQMTKKWRSLTTLLTRKNWSWISTRCTGLHSLLRRVPATTRFWMRAQPPVSTVKLLSRAKVSAQATSLAARTLLSMSFWMLRMALWNRTKSWLNTSSRRESIPLCRLWTHVALALPRVSTILDCASSALKIPLFTMAHGPNM